MKYNKLKPIIIAFEGMPKSGKTSILSTIIDSNNFKAIVLDELYFTKEQLLSLEDKRGALNESKWFIEEEIKRGNLIKQNNNLDIILVDRMYISTLAYCYARSKINKRPKEFHELVKYFNFRKNNMINYDYIIIFDNTVNGSISNRGNTNISSDLEYWVNKNFLKFYRNFYIEQAYKYTNAEIIIIDASKRSWKNIYTEVYKCLLNINKR